MKKAHKSIIAASLMLTANTVLSKEEIVKKVAPPVTEKQVVAPSSKPAATPSPVPVAKVTPQEYERSKLFGKPIYDDATGKLKMVLENDSQTHSRENFVLVRVKNIQVRPNEQEIGRVRVAVWDSKDSYAVEGVKPFRASSHFAKDAVNHEMLFKIGGLEVGKSYSFFAHFDMDNKGVVKRNRLGMPLEPYIFSNGLKKGGLFSKPTFESTLVKFTGSGQEIVLTF